MIIYGWKLRNTFFSLFHCFLLVSIIFSQELPFPTSARSLALGGANLGITDLKNIVYFNPAALGFNQGTYLSLDIRTHNYNYQNTFFRTPYNNSEIGLSACLIKKSTAVALSYRRKGNTYNEAIYFGGISNDSTYINSDERTRGLYHEYYLVVYRGWQLSRSLFIGSNLWLLHSASESFRDKNGFFARNTFSSAVNIATVVQFNESISFAIQAQNLIKLNWRYVILDYYGNRKYLRRLPLRLHLGGRVRFMHGTMLYIDVRDVYSEPLRSPYSFNTSFHFGVERPLVDIVTAYVGYQVSKIRKNFFLFSEELTHLFSVGMSIEYRDYTFDVAMVFRDRAKTIRDFEVKFQEDVIHYSVQGSGNKFSVTFGRSL